MNLKTDTFHDLSGLGCRIVTVHWLFPAPPSPYNTNTRCFPRSNDVGEAQKYSSSFDNINISPLPVKTFEGGQIFRYGLSFLAGGTATAASAGKRLRIQSSRTLGIRAELCRRDNSTPFVDSINGRSDLLIHLRLQKVLFRVSGHLSQSLPLA